MCVRCVAVAQKRGCYASQIMASHTPICGVLSRLDKKSIAKQRPLPLAHFPSHRCCVFLSYSCKQLNQHCVWKCWLSSLVVCCGCLQKPTGSALPTEPQNQTPHNCLMRAMPDTEIWRACFCGVGMEKCSCSALASCAAALPAQGHTAVFMRRSSSSSRFLLPPPP